MGLKESGLRGSLRNVSVGIAPIPDEAVLYLPVDEGSGTTTADSVGDNNGDIQGPDWLSDSDLEGGWGLEYATATDRVVLSQIDDILAEAEQFSVGVTLRKTADQSGSDAGDTETFFSHTTDSGFRFCSGILDGDIYATTTGDAGAIGGNQPSAPYLSRIFVQYDGVNDSISLFRDKSEINDTANPTQSSSSDSGHEVGNQQQRDRGMRNGVLSGYTVYNDIVSPETDFDFSAVTD